MTQYLIMCRSLTYAQKTAKVLERAGFTATIIKAPQGLSTSGCGYSVTLRGRIEDARNVLKSNDVPYGKVFRRRESGEYSEVSV